MQLLFVSCGDQIGFSSIFLKTPVIYEGASAKQLNWVAATAFIEAVAYSFMIHDVLCEIASVCV